MARDYFGNVVTTGTVPSPCGCIPSAKFTRLLQCECGQITKKTCAKYERADEMVLVEYDLGTHLLMSPRCAQILVGPEYEPRVAVEERM